MERSLYREKNANKLVKKTKRVHFNKTEFEDKINVSHKEFIRNTERNLSLEDKLSLGFVSRNFRDKFPHNTVYSLVYRDRKARQVRIFYNFKRLLKVLRSLQQRRIKFTEKDLIYLEKGTLIRKDIIINNFRTTVIITKNIIE